MPTVAVTEAESHTAIIRTANRTACSETPRPLALASSKASTLSGLKRSRAARMPAASWGASEATPSQSCWLRAPAPQIWIDMAYSPRASITVTLSEAATMLTIMPQIATVTGSRPRRQLKASTRPTAQRPPAKATSSPRHRPGWARCSNQASVPVVRQKRYRASRRRLSGCAECAAEVRLQGRVLRPTPARSQPAA